MSSQAGVQPKPYRPGRLERAMEGLRYGGGIGQWSWLIHRVTGIGIAIFLVIHIVDTFFVVAYPALYDHTVSIYGGVVGENYFGWMRWLFRLGELGLIACVLFHAINGIRVILVDFAPSALKYQKEMAWAVIAAFVVMMVPITAVVALPLLKAPESHWKVPTEAAGPSEVVAR
jgi:succinate dehydrogenase / fumarate reductase cytochrome b subunit